MNPCLTHSPRSASLPLPPGEGRGEGAPRGFTLVELLVVIGIIALLAALLTPVVMQSLTKARNAAIKAEIDMLHMAIMNYRTEYGSFPPCDSPLPYGLNSAAVNHLRRIFPRCSAPVVQFDANGLAGETGFPALTKTNALVAWLGGYTENPLSPLRPAANRKKLFDFDQSRLNGLQFSPSGKPNSPYIYINSSAYNSNAYDVVNFPNRAGALRESYAGDVTPFTNVLPENNSWFNPDTFQILCAGRDEEFGTDDDLSNFWPGTRREYLDSLKD